MEQPLEISIFPDRPVVYASFGQRVGALVIDWIIIFVIDQVLSYMGPIGNLVSLVSTWLYLALMESSARQATVGKMALGIKVTDMNGRRLSFGRALGRNLAQVISFMILLLGYFMVLWDEKRQGLHDKIAGTLVVVADK